MSDTTIPAPASRFGKPRPKVPAFARFVGTSAFRIDRRRARAFARFLAARRQEQAAADAKA